VIEVRVRKTYFAPTKGRSYLTKKAAIHNEAKAIIYKRFPPVHESDEYEGSTCIYAGEHIDVRDDSSEWFWRRHAQLSRALKNKGKGE